SEDLHRAPCEIVRDQGAISRRGSFDQAVEPASAHCADRAIRRDVGGPAKREISAICSIEKVSFILTHDRAFQGHNTTRWPDPASFFRFSWPKKSGCAAAVL